MGLLRQQPRARLALTEGLQRRQTLNRIQELGREGAVGARTRQGISLVPALERGRGDQGEQRGAEEDGGHRHVEPGDEGEDQDRADRRDEQLRQIFAEVDLQLLDAVDQRDQDVAGAGQTEMRRAQRHDLVVQRGAQIELNRRRRAVRDHDPGVLQAAAGQNDQGGDRAQGEDIRERHAGEDQAQQPAEQRQARDPQRRRQKADGDRAPNAPAHPARKRPKPWTEIHLPNRPCCTRWFAPPRWAPWR